MIQLVLVEFFNIVLLFAAIFDTWSRILHAVPDSVLWLLQFPASGEANIRAEAKKRGLDESRLRFTAVAPKSEHISRGRIADLFLDTPLCNAHTTGTDILWGGIPVLTRPLESLASRVGASLLNSIDCGELIAQSMEDYEKKAIALGLDHNKLRKMQQKVKYLRFRRPLFDTKRWCADWQKLLLQMVVDYRKYCQHLAKHGYEELHHLKQAGLGLDGLPLSTARERPADAICVGQKVSEPQSNGFGIHQRNVQVHSLPGRPVTIDPTPCPMFQAPTPVKVGEGEFRPHGGSKGYTSLEEVVSQSQKNHSGTNQRNGVGVNHK